MHSSNFYRPSKTLDSFIIVYCILQNEWIVGALVEVIAGDWGSGNADGFPKFRYSCWCSRYTRYWFHLHILCTHIGMYSLGRSMRIAWDMVWSYLLLFYRWKHLTMYAKRRKFQHWASRKRLGKCLNVVHRWHEDGPILHSKFNFILIHTNIGRLRNTRTQFMAEHYHYCAEIEFYKKPESKTILNWIKSKNK